MDCRLVQVPDADRHLDWCKTGRVFAALDALENAEADSVSDGPGVDGFTRLCTIEIMPGPFEGPA